MRRRLLGWLQVLTLFLGAGAVVAGITLLLTGLIGPAPSGGWDPMMLIALPPILLIGVVMSLQIGWMAALGAGVVAELAEARVRSRVAFPALCGGAAALLAWLGSRLGFWALAGGGGQFLIEPDAWRVVTAWGVAGAVCAVVLRRLRAGRSKT